MMVHTNRVFIALGSNLGNRLGNLRQAVRALSPDVQPIQVSPVYETQPWGYAAQPAFLNAIVEAETDLKPGALLAYLKAIEVKIGRQPGFRFGPREIDLDILLYNHQIVSLPGIEIPHPRMHARAFVLVPLADLAPDFVHPVLHCTVLELLLNLDQSGVREFPESLPL